MSQQTVPPDLLEISTGFNGCLQLDFCALQLEIEFLGRVRVANIANLLTGCKLTQCSFFVKNSRKIEIELESKSPVFLTRIQLTYVPVLTVPRNSNSNLRQLSLQCVRYNGKHRIDVT